jgi:uncharacterized membrane protein YqiK
MNETLLNTLLWVGIPLLVVVFSTLFFQPILRLFGIIFIAENENGIVNKKFVLFGSNKTLPNGSLIATKGEAGWQVDMLAPGIHFFFWPWQYEIKRQEVIEIKETQLGLVKAKDGAPLTLGRVLGKVVGCNNFQDARAFLNSGGQRGPQLAVIPPSTYRINTELFEVIGARVTEIDDQHTGIVTTMDGTPLMTNHIAGPTIAGHEQFQDAQAFITNGGNKGLQEQVLLAGRYYINPWFATIEQKELSLVDIANVGVIVSYVGEAGKDLSGDTFKHGNLVADGCKGVWQKPLDPGKYPINPFTHKIESVSTANIVLNWATGKTEAHRLDAGLSTIKLRSKDGFAFNLDVSQIIHIPHQDAPKVIARFGTVQNLVTQVLEPTIGNYFRNAAQNSDVIEFLQNRTARQNEAKVAIAAALNEYNVEAVDTLIGDINPPEALMKTLTDRKQAEQEKTTFETQQIAQETRKALEQAKAIADTQPEVVKAERLRDIAEFQKTASITEAQGRAESRKIAANAEAEAIKVEGNAKAEVTMSIGKAEADVIELKIKSMQSDNYASIEVAKELAKSRVPIVPSIVMGGNDSNGGSSAISMLSYMIARKLQDDLGGDVDVKPPTPPTLTAVA